jgi:hypothetical protein
LIKELERVGICLIGPAIRHIIQSASESVISPEINICMAITWVIRDVTQQKPIL